MTFRWQVYPIFSGVPSPEPFFVYMDFIPNTATIDPHVVAERLGAELIENA